MDQQYQSDFPELQATAENVGYATRPHARFGYPREFPPTRAAQGPYYFKRQPTGHNRVNRNAVANAEAAIEQVTEAMDQCSLNEIVLNEKVTVKREVQNAGHVRNAQMASRVVDGNAENSVNGALNADAQEFVPMGASQGEENDNKGQPTNQGTPLGSVVANLHAAAQNAAMVQTAAQVVEGYCLGGQNYAERIGIVARQMFIYAMSYQSYKTMGELAMLLEARVYVFAERKSFMDYFRDWTTEEVKMRTFLASVPGVSCKMRFVMALSAHLATKFNKGAENALFFQETVFTMMNDLLFCNSLGNIRAIVHVLMDYGETLYERDSGAVELVLNRLRDVSQKDNQLSVVKRLVNALFSVKAEWDAPKDIPAEAVTNANPVEQAEAPPTKTPKK